MILGGSSESKFFQIIREKNSLSYYTNSSLNKLDSLMLIAAGISKENFDKTVKLIKKLMKEMEDGIFSDEELNNAKLTATTSIRMSEDNQEGIINNYLFNDLDNFPLPDERIKLFNG